MAEADSSMYPSYSLDFNLVREAIGVHLEEFLVVTCRLVTQSMMLPWLQTSWRDSGYERFGFGIRN